MRSKSKLAVQLVAVAFAMLGLTEPQAWAQPSCTEKKGSPAQRNVKNLRELAPNTTRATLSVSLDGQQSSDGSVTLSVKGHQRVAKAATDKAASAEIIDTPHGNNRDLRADIAVSATPNATGTYVAVRGCVSNDAAWKAGKYEGTVNVYGPRFHEFSYGIVVTQKWPPCLPLGILAVVMFAFGIIEFLSDKTTKLGGGSLYILVGVVAGLLTFYSQYSTNDTWGDDWEKQIIALVLAALTTAIAGRAAAQKFFSTS